VTDIVAYADDCGTHKDARFCLLLGYLASPEEWALFRRDWQEALRAARVPEFHAKIFFPRRFKRASHDNPFTDWSEVKAAQFLDSLLGLIDRYRLWPIGGAASVPDFLQLGLRERRLLTGAQLRVRTEVGRTGLSVVRERFISSGAPDRPYFLCLQSLMTEAIYFSKPVRDAHIDFWLDRQGSLEGRIRDTYREIISLGNFSNVGSLGDLAFADSQSSPELQAADLYAYVWNRYLHKNTNSELRRAFAALTKKRTNIGVVGKAFYEKVLAAGRKEREQRSIGDSLV